MYSVVLPCVTEAKLIISSSNLLSLWATLLLELRCLRLLLHAVVTLLIRHFLKLLQSLVHIELLQLAETILSMREYFGWLLLLWWWCVVWTLSSIRSRTRSSAVGIARFLLPVFRVSTIRWYFFLVLAHFFFLKLVLLFPLFIYSPFQSLIFLFLIQLFNPFNYKYHSLTREREREKNRYKGNLPTLPRISKLIE